VGVTSLQDGFARLVRGSIPADRLPVPGARLELRPLPGAAAAGVVAGLSELGESTIVVVAKTPGAAEDFFSDLKALSRRRALRYLPQRETLPYEDSDPHVEISSQRVDALTALVTGRTSVLVTTARGLIERSPFGDADLVLRLRTGGTIRRDDLARRLERMGFEQVPTVREIGEFSVRGGIVDLFPFGHELPIRLELWGDEIESLRKFELVSQRSVESLREVDVLPIDLTPELFESTEMERRSALELLPPATLIVELSATAGAVGRRQLWEETTAARAEIYNETALPPEALVMPPKDADALLGGARRITIQSDDEAEVVGPSDALDLGIEPPPPIDRDMGRLVAYLSEHLSAGDDVVVLCDNEGQLERLEEILVELAGRALTDRVALAIGSISGGFRLPSRPGRLVLTDHEVFRRTRRLRRASRFRGVATLDSISSLSSGDYVVHMEHGIGQYVGLETVTVGEETIETVKIRYADGETLRVPPYRLDLIERWTQPGEDVEDVAPPPVHKLGGKKWKALRRRTEESIHEMAVELLELYAHRSVSHGFGFSAESRWQREMESAFLYEDTPDQRAAWEDTRRDMESGQIMDRLICGDVGYGKTEIAIRAAFKAVQDGKQVAVLAPTTILVEQHAHTFGERLAGFPVNITALSRLRSPREQSETLAGVADGKIDIVIGTHRLLSPDVGFSDLGLLVVDEEQRFGVRHKERLKDLKRSVDVLTLTATPIPRTMQLALGGLRDMSLIETAPRDRVPIITHLLEWSDSIIRDAMRRELDRGGQVFFVHDRIETIDALAARVRGLVPEARVAVAHGRMPERELERTMHDLMEKEIDVLVSTSIIENGLDVPTANTMIVDRADRFGLSQLYQIRGRVGRSHHRAYCYLVVPHAVTPEAIQRLRVLEHHTELGSGYRVALKDLQLRGAGNILGESQSGFAQAVGFDTYQRMLEKTVRRLKSGGKSEDVHVPQVAIDGASYIPDDYVPAEDQKLHLYRRLSKAVDIETVDGLRDELRDRFGPLPEAAERLLASQRLKLLGAPLGIEWTRVSEDSARINFRADAFPRLAPLRDALADRQVAVEVRRIDPLSLLLARAGVEPLLPTLIDALEILVVSAAGRTQNAEQTDKTEG
jgi:transcription-repair coupling factor (superfamily II helicase)